MIRIIRKLPNRYLRAYLLGVTDGWAQPYELLTSWNLDSEECLWDPYEVFDSGINLGQFLRAGRKSQSYREFGFPLHRKGFSVKIYLRKLATIALSNPVLSTKDPDNTWSFRPFDALAGLTNALDERLHHQLCEGRFGKWEDHQTCGWCEEPAEKCRVKIEVPWPEDMVEELNRDREGEDYTGVTITLCRESGMEFYPLLRPLGFPFGLVQKFWDKTWAADDWLRVGTHAGYVRFQWCLDTEIDEATMDLFEEKASARFTSVNSILFYNNKIVISAYANTTFAQDEFETWLVAEGFPSKFERSEIQ